MADDEPKFDLSEGTGETLGSLPCFTAVSSRGAAGKALESALESLHRLVYGRAGISGRRRAALYNFKGFPPSMRAEVEEKIGKLTKDRLRDMIKALGLAVHISQTQSEVAAGVAAFLMSPKDEGKIKIGKITTTANKKNKGIVKDSSAKASKRRAETSFEAAEETVPKKAKAEIPVTTSNSTTNNAAEQTTKSTPQQPLPPAKTVAAPSDDAVLVEVYRRVLAMSYEERAVLGVKALRTTLEEHFQLSPGGLKSKKDIITTTASDCVRALREAEDRAVMALQAIGAANASSMEAVTSMDAVAAQTAEEKVEEEDTADPVESAKTSVINRQGESAAPAVSNATAMHPGVMPL